MSAGRIDEARTGLRKLLQSGFVDWLHGGLFHTALGPDLRGVKFDKLTVENAEMANVLACLAAKARDPIYRQLAEATFNNVIDEFVTKDAVYSFEWADALDLGRNPSYSLRPSLMARRFTPSGHAWLRTRLGLIPE